MVSGFDWNQDCFFLNNFLRHDFKKRIECTSENQDCFFNNFLRHDFEKRIECTFSFSYQIKLYRV
jgi:hypothetical protein